MSLVPLLPWVRDQLGAMEAVAPVNDFTDTIDLKVLGNTRAYYPYTYFSPLRPHALSADIQRPTLHTHSPVQRGDGTRTDIYTERSTPIWMYLFVYVEVCVYVDASLWKQG